MHWVPPRRTSISRLLHNPWVANDAEKEEGGRGTTSSNDFHACVAGCSHPFGREHTRCGQRYRGHERYDSHLHTSTWHIGPVGQEFDTFPSWGILGPAHGRLGGGVMMFFFMSAVRTPYLQAAVLPLSSSRRPCVTRAFIHFTFLIAAGRTSKWRTPDKLPMNTSKYSE